ncbi:glutamate--tRNA ligase family protein [Mucilaginibacter gracilis]|uniref:glutamate--tRNA ligase family protein n=1 Tax=Mucilaginibacter gracilis TaxID=423350 RepID=UPI0029393680|nr:glutamate--tRNA ligase family protein [Mucilaginibacter gracilis]
MKQYNKTRIAPTPSGFLHLGNVLSFVITAALARKHGAKILLRIDDIDQARANEAYIQDIFDTLNFLEIPWHEGPRNTEQFAGTYSQLHRIDTYQAALTTLANKEQVFACTCSRKQILVNSVCGCISKKLPLTTPNTSWRLITSPDAELTVKNCNGQITTEKLPLEMQNFVVKKKDGFPAYQLTSVIDDVFFGVDIIIRGEDLWPSTLAQQQLALALGLQQITDAAFYHHRLILGFDGAKLSKSAGATSVRYLRQQGKTPADIYTIIARMLGINKTIPHWQQLAEIAVFEDI